MKTFVAMGCMLAGTLCLAEQAEATSYSRLVEALREQRQNPGPEADARVRQTEMEAAIFHSAFYAVPALLVGYLVVRAFSSLSQQSGMTKSR